jgi:glycosyltransferase involved in cell wall biosynthesis
VFLSKKRNKVITESLLIQGIFYYDRAMQKILLYTDTPLVGGAEKHIHQLAKTLLNDGFLAKVVCSKYKKLDLWCENLKKDGIPVIRLNVNHKHDPRHLLQLKNILKAENPDILHLHLWNPGACRYAFWTTSPSQLPKIIATEHDPFPLSGIKKRLKKQALAKTHQTITVSNNNQEQIISWYPELKNSTTVIHNGIDLEQFEKALIHFTHQEKHKIKTQLFQANDNDFIITTVATLHPRKGLIYLIEAYKEVQETNPQTKLVLIGEGPQKKDLEKKVKKLGLEDKVVFLNHQESIPKLLKSSDLFVLPSIKEAFGLVLLEAMAAQIPIIASAVGGIPEIIENNKNGILVEPANPKMLAEKILFLIKNAPIRQKMVFLGHHRVKDFDLKKMAQKTEAVYHKVLQADKILN